MDAYQSWENVISYIKGKYNCDTYYPKVAYNNYSVSDVSNNILQNGILQEIVTYSYHNRSDHYFKNYYILIVYQYYSQPNYNKGRHCMVT